ncbi:hypothetical protein BD309DRAFT_955891 [Dichomitus squalens]|uniref:Uncharacterized protein n=1 Tax=Dichomitus squalens TaxID=114155 RepID=A0A4Q9PUD8_9APHY|nr:hypothetical protein BD309DRAFT_955891 [Dichomitus squalens]TBU58069.1 hypothetical protein BD310DRAFT_927920 [Dichomitus squalens]
MQMRFIWLHTPVSSSATARNSERCANCRCPVNENGDSHFCSLTCNTRHNGEHCMIVAYAHSRYHQHSKRQRQRSSLT